MCDYCGYCCGIETSLPMHRFFDEWDKMYRHEVQALIDNAPKHLYNKFKREPAVTYCDCCGEINIYPYDHKNCRYCESKLNDNFKLIKLTFYGKVRKIW